MEHFVGERTSAIYQQLYPNPYQQLHLPNVAFYQNEMSALPNMNLPNVVFYQNEMSALPNTELIEGILIWKGNYQMLEENKTCLNWLFPNRILGFNREAFELKDEEAKLIRETPKLKERVKRAFEMMLDFYGMKLTEENHFELTENSEERLQKLNENQDDNFKRISRILLAIKELGYEKLMLPWLTFLADLIYKDGKLEKAKHSFHQHWMEALDAEDHITLKHYIQQYTCPITSSVPKGIRNEMPQVKFPNVAFYRNEIPSVPDGELIENILTQWKGDNNKLERNHSYIQWLFPNKVVGSNTHCPPLLDEEGKIIRETPLLKQRVKRAFKMMLEFYGMKLTEENHFELAENSNERLYELNHFHNHNFLRISRILLALKELGHSNLMLPWLKFLADLIYSENLLPQASISFEKFWLQTLDSEDMTNLTKYVEMQKSYL